MLTEIMQHTPKWVFFLFAGLLWLGAKQLIANSVSLFRTTLMPLAMAGLSVYGVTSAFGDAYGPLLAWAVAAAALLALVLQRPLPAGTRYDPVGRRFHLAGSGWPLVLMMGIFFTKYAVAAALAMHPGLRGDGQFSLWVPAVYGVFTGTFVGRAVRLWKLAIRDDRALAAGSI